MEKNQRLYDRFDIHQRIQHFLLFTSFIVLAFTGLPIKWHDTGWAHTIINLFGSFDNLFRVHLGGASVMFACCAYHLVYLVVNALRGKRSWAQVPTLKDVKDLIANMRYFFGLSRQKPQFDRYSYKEKFDYWAVFWGMAMIGGSGLMMWFPDVAFRYFPKWFVSASRVAHSDEAMLAVIVIFIWHLFNVHFSPHLFPASWVWLHGKMTREEMMEEHPVELEKLEQQEDRMAVRPGSNELSM